MNESNIYEGFAARISEAITLAGGPSEVHRRTGITLATLSRWRKAEADPSRTNLIKMAEVSGVSLEWLATGVGARQAGTNTSCPPARSGVFWPNPDGEPQLAAWEAWAGQVDRDAFVPVIYAPRLSAAAGNGLVNYLDEQETEALMFKRSFLQHLGVRPHQVFCMRVKGDSMEPTLANGSIIMVDTAQRHPREGLYVLRSDNELRVKRLQPIPGGKLRIKSDNHAYDDVEVSLAELVENELEIIGHVVHLNTKV